MFKKLASSLVICFPILSFAQQFGGNPPQLKWKQINTDSARVVFPSGLDSQANRVADIIHRLAAENANALGNKLKKINIVLQNQTVISNGYVNLGPYRSEFFMTPVFNNLDQGSIGWADQLALHEYRHVQQYNNFNRGFSKLMGVLFGEDGYALASNAAIPDWFFEGDAVYQETILSEQGRGRLPQFMNTYAAVFDAGKKYSWMKLRNGSFKHYVPTHYHLGYILVKYGYERMGTDFWMKVTRDAAAFKGFVYPFQHAIKKHSNLSLKTFVDAALLHFYASMKTNNTDSIDNIAVKNLTRNAEINNQANKESINTGSNHKNFITNYYFPYSAGADSVIYMKSSGRKLPAFYLKDKTGEKKIRLRAISMDEQFSYRNGKIIYAAYESDARWGWRDFSVIRLLDMKNGKEKKITTQSKYFTPDISPDGQRIAAVFYSPEGRNEIHILNSETGALTHTIKSSDIDLFTDPKFIDDRTVLSAIRLPDGKMCLAISDIEMGSTVRLTDLSLNVIGHPQVYDGIVYFTASYNGNNDIYALRLADRKIVQVTQTQHGGYFPNAGEGKLFYSAFTADGYQLMQSGLPDIDNMHSESGISKFFPRFPVSNGKNYLSVEDQQRNFQITNYKKSTQLINFHSWRPYYSDPVFSFSVYGENVLNTLQTEIYYQYNENENEHATGVSAVYGTWFPFITAGSQYTFHRSAIINNRSKEWKQLDSYIGLSIPLNIIRGNTIRNFNAGSNFVLRNEMVTGASQQFFANENFGYLSHFVNWGQRMQRATQHIYSPFSYSISLAHRHAITTYTGYQFLANTSITAPGLHSTHSIVLTGVFQQRDTLNPQLFSDRFSYSRGYDGRYFSRMWRLSANYHFTILFPDWGFANILYFSRVRGNVFYDFTKTFSRNKQTKFNQRSAGLEIYFDTKWWNQYPLTIGFRISHLFDNDLYDGFKGNVFEVILPVSILPR